MTDTFQDILLRYVHVRARAERGTTRDVLDELGRLRDAIKARLVQLDPVTDGPLRAVRLRQLLTEIDRLIQSAKATLQDRLTSGITELAQTDHELLAEPLAEATDTTPSDFRPAVIAGVVGGSARYLTLTTNQLRANLVKALAVDRPESIDDALDGIDTAFDHTAGDLRRIAETTHAAAFNETVAGLYRAANLDTWRWTALLDGTTCLICAVHDGELLGPTDPRPPAHGHCRCTIIPIIPGETEPAFESPGNYEQWLERQPEAVQREIVGPTRYKLFLANRKKPGFLQGGLPLSLTVEDGRIISVASLKEKWRALLVLQEKAE